MSDANRKFNVVKNSQIKASFETAFNDFVIKVDSGSIQGAQYAVLSGTGVQSQGDLTSNQQTIQLQFGNTVYVGLPINPAFQDNSYPRNYTSSITRSDPKPSFFTPPASSVPLQSFYFEIEDQTQASRGANFTGQYFITLVSSPGGKINGTFTIPGKPSSSLSVGTTLQDYEVPYNTVFDLTAVPDSGFKFAGWQSPVQGALMANLQTRATFEESAPSNKINPLWFIGGGALVVIIIAIVLFLVLKKK